MSGYATAQKILRAGYFWPSIFKDCILSIRSCHECQIYQQKMHAPPAPLHPVVTIDPFAKWGIDYMTCNPRSAGGAWLDIVLSSGQWPSGSCQQSSSYDASTHRWHAQVQLAFDAVLCLMGLPKFSEGCHWVTPFQLVYGLEATLPIECEIPSLKLAVELLPNTTPIEERLLYLERLDKTRRLASLAIEAQKKRVKTHFDHTVHPRSFVEGDLVLLYDQANDKLGVGKFEPMWHEPYIVKRVLQKGAYELIDYEGNPLDKPRNGLYLEKYYA
eukprot:PITA_21196